MTRISQRTVAKVVGGDRRKIPSGRKLAMVETLDPPALLCEICAICGFKFGIQF